MATSTVVTHTENASTHNDTTPEAPESGTHPISRGDTRTVEGIRHDAQSLRRGGLKRLDKAIVALQEMRAIREDGSIVTDEDVFRRLEKLLRFARYHFADLRDEIENLAMRAVANGPSAMIYVHAEKAMERVEYLMDHVEAKERKNKTDVSNALEGVVGDLMSIQAAATGKAAGGR